MLEQKGEKVTFDYLGNIVIVQNPKIAPKKDVTFAIATNAEGAIDLNKLDELEDAEQFNK